MISARGIPFKLVLIGSNTLGLGFLACAALRRDRGEIA